MRFNDKRGITLASGFILHSDDLLDKRCSVDTIEDRDELVKIHACPIGLIVYVKSNKRTYVYNGGNSWDYFTKGPEYVHPQGDGNLHVPATGDSHNGYFLCAGPTPENISWKQITPSSIGAATTSHTHDNDTITNLDCSKLTGVISIERLPKGALERLIRVADDNTRFSLTIDKVQEGDTVKVLSTGKMYMVIDTNNLLNENGYEEYTAGSASSVPWSGVIGKPSTLPCPSPLIISINNGTTEGYNKFTYDGSSAKNINVTLSSIGAAANSHQHSKSDITDFPTSLKNPKSLNITLQGSQSNNYYDGSVEKNIDITPETVGAARERHTHTKDQITDLVIPNKMPNPASLTISLNGTSQGAYDGSSAKNINVTPSSIGAASSSHTHTKSNITDFPISLKNPASLTISLNGTSQGAYDGSSAKNINVTPSSIGAASSSHTHGNDTITNLDCSKLTGKLDIARLPAAALERLIRVADDNARFSLTTSTAQEGDIIKVLSTGKMYVIINQNKLSNNDGYEEFTAGSASSVPWSGVTGKPSTYTPSSHTHTKSNITDFPISLKNPASLTISLNGTSQGAYDGSSAKNINVTPSSIGAASSSHTHKYAGSSSAGGSATSAITTPVPVGTILMSISSTVTFFSTCFGGVWKCIGNIDAFIGNVKTPIYMFKKIQL